MNAVEHMELQEAQSQARFHPKAAVLAGLLVGIFLLAFSKGVAWSSSGLPDRAMGRPILDGFSGQVFLISSTIQLFLAICYALGICSIIYRFKPMTAVL